jgi:hypothetical protein
MRGDVAEAQGPWSARFEHRFVQVFVFVAINCQFHDDMMSFVNCESDD